MTFTLFLILSLCTVQFIGVILIITFYRKQFSNMHGMLFSMTLGMLSGILFGTVLGILLNGDLFTSTIISILIGLSIGFLAGLPFTIIAVIDGSVSGLMGGMMGAMLGEMIVITNPDSTIKLLAFFTMMILLIIQYLSEDSITSKIPFSVQRFPYFYIIIITILFFFLKDITIVNMDTIHHH